MEFTIIIDSAEQHPFSFSTIRNDSDYRKKTNRNQRVRFDMAYFPNGSSGEVLEIQCGRCPLGDGPCPVVGIQMLYNYDQLDDGQENLKNAMSILVDDQGICQVHKQLMENITVVRNNTCEHGIEDGFFCQECNSEYKRAAKCDGE